MANDEFPDAPEPEIAPLRHLINGLTEESVGKTIGDALRRLREQVRRMSLQDAAKESGVAEGWIEGIEAGMPPTFDQLRKLAKTYRVDIATVVRPVVTVLPEGREKPVLTDAEMIGLRLRHALLDIGMNAGDFADALGVVRHYGSQMLHGKVPPSMRLLAKAAAIVGMPFETLMEGIGTIHAEEPEYII